MALTDALRSADVKGKFLMDADTRIALDDLITGTALYDRGDELCGRSVLIATTNQVTTAAALVELDGVVRRIVLCPPDLPLEHLPFVMDTAGVDAIVSDRTTTLRYGTPRPLYFIPCSRSIASGHRNSVQQHETEWVLLTSGTTGVPKLVVHTLASLAGAIESPPPAAPRAFWSTFYDIRRYGGLQIFLRAILTGTSLLLTSAQEALPDFLARIASVGVTHISGTPSHWRRVLMSSAAAQIDPEYIRLSGEVADQSLLSHLHTAYPRAKIVHAFASTEAGVAFEVSDGLEGFPERVLQSTPDVEMKVEDRSLRLRSARTASRYLGEQAPMLKDADGFVDTNDVVELRNGRYHFMGRRDGVINIGGLKVFPEEIEAVINRHPGVLMSLVRPKKNPITGSLVVADVVLNGNSSLAGSDAGTLQKDILQFCRESLSPYKVPATINILPGLTFADSGKLLRHHA